MLKRALLGLCAIVALGHLPGRGQEKQGAPEISLGRRLFTDDRFSTPDGDLPASCSHCHMLDENPQGPRAYTDFLARSWAPWRSADPRRDTLRNAPTILDADRMPLLHFDGEFRSLEDLVKGTLTGRSLGWLPAEKEKALRQVYLVVTEDKGEAGYVNQFRKAYGIDLEKLGRDEVATQVARALSDYLRSLKTARNSPYDEFARINRLPECPDRGEDPKAFAARLVKRVAELERQRELKLAAGFDATALRGLKIFFESGARPAVGNCAACHVPPYFTDFSFHNTGISQAEYDRVHGEGSFAALRIPGSARSLRPSARFRETPSPDRPCFVDLGYWNFVKLSGSGMRRAGESDDRLLRRMIAAFKTPTLRELAYSAPYMHNGAYPTLESVLAELIRISGLARAGGVRSADHELARIRISDVDVGPLVAFLNALNETLDRPGRQGAGSEKARTQPAGLQLETVSQRKLYVTAGRGRGDLAEARFAHAQKR